MLPEFNSPVKKTAHFLGLDIGSTTIKIIGLDNNGETVFQKYQRHLSNVRECLAQLLLQVSPYCAANLQAAFTGSGALDLASELDAPFIQEVLACALAIERFTPDADIILELGGEDAKLTYRTGGLEQRMNETCAGGTGAFIDQMAAFIGTDAAGLNELAQNHAIIYPIASRCGVFAKSDILPLLNEGCKREDIAASILQAIVDQTLSGLAQGRPIRGKIVFLGGPLFFLSALRERFQATLAGKSLAIFPPDGHYFVAHGAALHSRANAACPFSPYHAIQKLTQNNLNRIASLPPLFSGIAEIEDFRKKHADNLPESSNLETACGSAWLGCDCGSTTIKIALIDDKGRLLYSWYAENRGNPLPMAIEAIKNIYRKKNKQLVIRGSCVTGYGSQLLAAALRFDLDEVETVAHYEAAAFFDPEVSFILDIGGQDIKCLYIRNGLIERINLNEACSAGCGSFISTFARSLGKTLPEFVNSALTAKHPVDLGSRCTVFMNSRVKQAQKEGADFNDISAGLAYSVVRNALYKVMKIPDIGVLGRHIVAQGGAFLNDALLRALERELGIQVTRPAIAGLMGAFGAALIARKRLPGQKATALLDQANINAFAFHTSSKRCQKCANKCLLTITSFPDKRHFVSGNRCEQANASARKNLPNIAQWKYKRLFDYQPLPPEQAPRGVIGIPRVLNIYENYPLWFAIFHKLGFSVRLSAPSTRKMFFSACETIPSQTACYPAKLAHGHLQNLIDANTPNIFYPCIQREQTDADFRHGKYNCPVAIGYPELLAKNMRSIRQVNYIHAFLPLSRKTLARRLLSIPLFAKIPVREMEEAVKAGFDEMDKFRMELAHAGENALEFLQASNRMGLIVAGHPYHIDPEINHGIYDLINSCGLGCLTEDSISHLMPDPGPLRVVNQWAYHSRLYRAGVFAAAYPHLAVLQLVSFGCGLDAVTADQLEEITMRENGLYAQIKIDEGAAPGPARIRIRSLLAAMHERAKNFNAKNVFSAPNNPQSQKAQISPKKPGKLPPAYIKNLQKDEHPRFSHDMRHTHTLLVPQLSPLHFQFAKEIFAADGYDALLLTHVDREAIELGLRHVNNDACYPAIVVIGQLLHAVKNGLVDKNKVALVISQTGGGCRATNYVAFLRRALKNAGLENIPVANFSTNMRAPGIKLTFRMLQRLIMAGHYGDAFMRCLHRLRPYEKEKGACAALIGEWSQKAAKNIASGNLFAFQRNMFAIIDNFEKLPIYNEPRRPRIGLVGEILLKFHPDANNNAAQIIENEGGEAEVTSIMDFMLYGLYDHIFNYEHLAGSGKNWLLAKAGIAWQEFARLSLRLALNKSKRFGRYESFGKLRQYAGKVISLGHATGEGWLLTAEMVRMLENGVSGILCMQPFGCLPNHIVGKGMIRELKRRYPHAAIMALDYDAGASQTNQINRIKLMMRAGNL